jgi:hypothetical protein
MEPSSHHVPPTGFTIAARVNGAPPSIETLRNASKVKKPIHFPSGEKKGSNPPSVPTTGTGSYRSERRRTIRVPPSAPAET